MTFTTSCSEDFLERAPLNSISDASFWSSTEDLQMYVNNFYSRGDLLPWYPDWSGPRNYDNLDNYIYVNYDREINGENTLPSSGGGWSDGDWASLRDVNYFLANYTRVDVAFDAVKQYVGEALYFHSYFYFEKLKRFGDVPYTTQLVEIDGDLLMAARLPRNAVADSILLALDRAVEYLPARAGAAWNGRITKECALALQSRIALYEGTWEKYHGIKNTAFKVAGSDGTKFIQKAAEAAGALMAMAEQNGFPGLDNVGEEMAYFNLFNQTDYTNSKEILVWRKYQRGTGPTSTFVWDNIFPADKGLTKRFVDSYLCTDGKPISASPLYKGDKTLGDVVTNRDPRMYQTVATYDDEHIYRTDSESGSRTYCYFPQPSGQEWQCPTGYWMYKYMDMDYPVNLSQQSETGFIIMRYAETLLNYAEAKAELGTITQDDIDKTVNALRRRVGMDGLLDIGNITPDPDWQFGGISPLLNEIRRERMIELVAEFNCRRQDLFRWAAMDEVIVGKRPLGAYRDQWIDFPPYFDRSTNVNRVVTMNPIYQQAFIDMDVTEDGYIDPYKQWNIGGYHFNLGRNYLSPLPTDQLVLNPNLVQNPGW
jgi:hypothetical protein